MDYRFLGRTGISVSPLYLGAMLFGPWGNEGRQESVRILHRALDAGINLVDSGNDDLPADNSYGAAELAASARRR